MVWFYSSTCPVFSSGGGGGGGEEGSGRGRGESEREKEKGKKGKGKKKDQECFVTFISTFSDGRKWESKGYFFMY